MLMLMLMLIMLTVSYQGDYAVSQPQPEIAAPPAQHYCSWSLPNEWNWPSIYAASPISLLAAYSARGTTTSIYSGLMIMILEMPLSESATKDRIAGTYSQPSP
jgi:hypothetical protein